MKKTYLKPTLRVAEIEVQSIIANSTLGYRGDDSGNGTAETKGQSIWDIEW